MKRIGIIGGMGPAATAELHKKMIEICQHKYNCVEDTDFPDIIIYEVPIEGFDEKGNISEYLLSELEKGAKILCDDDCELLVLDCNTIHHHLKDLRSVVNIPILSIIEEVHSYTMNKYQKIGLLSSQTTNKLKIYDEEFSKKTIVHVKPEEEKRVTQIILDIMGDTQTDHSIQAMNSLISSLQSRGAEAVILGCTELSIIKDQLTSSIPILDSTYILAEATLREAMKNI